MLIPMLLCRSEIKILGALHEMLPFLVYKGSEKASPNKISDQSDQPIDSQNNQCYLDCLRQLK
jgi:hypothetical protein